MLEETEKKQLKRLMPVGAEVAPEGKGVHFRVWAPEATKVDVVFAKGAKTASLKKEGGGYYSGWVAGAKAGSLYKFQLNGGEGFPDPASRFQPGGPHGWSQVVDPNTFAWTDPEWLGVKLAGQIIYEMHIGTFTQEGTWRSAIEKLAYLQETGITVVEIMPVACFPGKFGWGYDGALAFAPVAVYGTPDDFRAFVDRAHALGIGVILDVVYNHLGPDGNYLPRYAKKYFNLKLETDWGPAINFDGKQAGPVREYFRENACYWIREFHLDGLRLDATQDIHDSSKPHIIAECVAAARETAG